MSRGRDLILPAAAPLLLLSVLLVLNFYPPINRSSSALELVVAAGLAVVANFVATALAVRLLRDAVILRRAFVLSGLLFMFSLGVYVILISTLTEVPGGASRRLPVGLAYSKNFLEILPTNGDDEIVTKEEFLYELNRIYQPWSIAASTSLIFLSWIVLFASAGVFLVTHSRLQRLSIIEVAVQHGGDTVFSASTTQARLERTIRDRIPQLNLAVWRERTTSVEGQVCRVEVDGHPVGTGFLVGPDAIITNYHVVERLFTDLLAANRVTVRFDYKVLANSARSAGIVVALHPTDWKLDYSPYAECEKRGQLSGTPTLEELDYALLRLETPIGMEEFFPSETLNARRRGWLRLPTMLPDLSLKDPLLIVQHPDGAPLKLAIDTSAFLELNSNRTRMRYTTNTEPGSSGSPVFDLEWNLVALHHLGDPAVDKLTPEFNQGVPLDIVRRRIEDPTRAGSQLRMAAISARH
jgi:hypothetical protein